MTDLIESVSLEICRCPAPPSCGVNLNAQCSLSFVYKSNSLLPPATATIHVNVLVVLNVNILQRTQGVLIG